MGKRDFESPVRATSLGTSALAVVALVLSLGSFFLSAGLAAIVLGFLSLRRGLADGRQGRCDYAMNKHAKSTSQEPGLVLCYESVSGWNQAGGPELLTTNHHRGKGCNVLFLDWHVEFVPAERLGRLKWQSTR
jgi:prepilin-type processing-associated H-X9-DG protein